MNKIPAILLATLLLVSAGRGQAEPQYESSDRIRYIQLVLAALRSSDRNTLRNTRNYIHVIDQNTCRSSFTDLRTSCLLEAARKNCKLRRAGRADRKRCRLVSDVVVTNKLGEKAFIDAQTRYRIMGAHREYRTEIRAELWRRYAELVTDFIISEFGRPSGEDLAVGIDGYCAQSVNRRGLSWQYCVAATTWFIGTSHDRID